MLWHLNSAKSLGMAHQISNISKTLDTFLHIFNRLHPRQKMKMRLSSIPDTTDNKAITLSIVVSGYICTVIAYVPGPCVRVIVLRRRPPVGVVPYMEEVAIEDYGNPRENP